MSSTVVSVRCRTHGKLAMAMVAVTAISCDLKTSNSCEKHVWKYIVTHPFSIECTQN